MDYEKIDSIAREFDDVAERWSANYHLMSRYAVEVETALDAGAEWEEDTGPLADARQARAYYEDQLMPLDKRLEDLLPRMEAAAEVLDFDASPVARLTVAAANAPGAYTPVGQTKAEAAQTRKDVENAVLAAREVAQAVIRRIQKENAKAELVRASSTPNVETASAANAIKIAIMLKLEHPEWSDAKIAREAGCAGSTLTRSKAYQRLKGTAVRQRPSGFKNAATGEFDAVDNDDVDD